MKNIILILFVMAAFDPAFSQNFQFGILGVSPFTNNTNVPAQEVYFNINAAYQNPVKKENLENVMTLKDINSGYPSSWIADYVSTEISAINDGKTVKARGTDIYLTKEQKKIVQAADISTDIKVEVQYRYANPITNIVELRTAYFALTIIPTIQAEYIGGIEEMKNYLKENAISKISKDEIPQLKQTVIKFFVNEEGKVSDIRIVKASGNAKTDKLLSDIINKMPKWKPAEEKGKKVKQEFVFDMNIWGGGC